MMDNFNDKKINKPAVFGSKILIGEKIDSPSHNAAGDETPELIGLPKSSAELAEELIDYLITHNHQKVAKIIIEEARVYLSKLSNNNVFNMDQQLRQLEAEFDDLVKYFCQEEKEKLASKLKNLKIIIQTMESEHIRNFLQNLLEIIENYNKTRNKKSFDKKEEFKNFKENIKSGFSVLRNLL